MTQTFQVHWGVGRFYLTKPFSPAQPARAPLGRASQLQPCATIRFYASSSAAFGHPFVLLLSMSDAARPSKRTTAAAVQPPSSASGSLELQDTIRLSARGLAKVLGDLEARVMASIWKLDRPASARTVHTVVIRRHDVALLTVVTVLNKLVRKRLLRREARNGLLHFEATMTEDAFRKQTSRRVVEGILSFDQDAVAASLVDVLAEQDPEQLAELARLIARRMQR